MEIELPDGRIAEFPDHMPHEEIEQVLQQQFAIPKQQVKASEQPDGQQTDAYPDLGGIARDVGESVVSAPGAFLKGVMNVPEQVQTGAQYAGEHPFKSVGQAAIGAGELGAALFNAPYSLAQYLKSKDIPYFRSVADYVPHIPVDKIEEQLGIQPTEKGQSELRSLGQLVAGGGGLSKIPGATGRVGAVAGATGGQGGDPIHAALGAVLGEKAAKTLPKIPEIIREESELRKLDPEELEAEAELQKQTVSDLQKRDATQADLMQKVENLESQLDDIPDPTNRLPDLRFEGQYENLQNIFDQTQKATSEAHEAQGQQLGAGQDFETRAAPLVIEHVENVKGQISPRYDAINEGAKHVEVVIPNHKRAQEIQTQMDKLIGDGTINPMNDAVYDSILEQLEQQWPGDAVESIPAPQYINTYKSTRDLARIARQRSRQEGIAQPERQRWETQANQLEPIVRQQRGVLQQTLPDNLFNELLETDRLWAKNVIPFYRNKIYQDARQHGRVPQNMIDKTSGNAPHQQVMQQAIQSNPELNRLAIGQQYAHRPQELLTPNERLQPYIESHTPTRNLLQAQQRAHKTNQKTQQKLQALEPQRQFRQKQQEGVSQETKKQIDQRKRITKELNDTIKEIEELNKDARKLDDEIQKLGMTEERVRRKKQYDNRSKRLKNKLWDGAKTAMSYAVGGRILDSVFRTLFKN